MKYICPACQWTGETDKPFPCPACGIGDEDFPLVELTDLKIYQDINLNDIPRALCVPSRLRGGSSVHRMARCGIPLGGLPEVWQP
jgi:hypothetical protein